MEQTKNNLTELYKKTSCYESGVLIKNAIQNILDYRLMVGANVNEFSNKDTYKVAFHMLYENCRNSIAILNTLASSYDLDLIYDDDLNNKEKINEFTHDFVTNLCGLK